MLPSIAQLKWLMRHRGLTGWLSPSKICPFSPHHCWKSPHQSDKRPMADAELTWTWANPARLWAKTSRSIGCKGPRMAKWTFLVIALAALAGCQSQQAVENLPEPNFNGPNVVAGPMIAQRPAPIAPPAPIA